MIMITNHIPFDGAMTHPPWTIVHGPWPMGDAYNDCHIIMEKKALQLPTGIKKQQKVPHI